MRPWKNFSITLIPKMAVIVCCRAIVNHFNPKIESYAAVNHISQLSEEQVNTVQYSCLVLEVHLWCHSYPFWPAPCDVTLWCHSFCQCLFMMSQSLFLWHRCMISQSHIQTLWCHTGPGCQWVSLWCHPFWCILWCQFGNWKAPWKWNQDTQLYFGRNYWKRKRWSFGRIKMLRQRHQYIPAKAPGLPLVLKISVAILLPYLKRDQGW